MAIIRVECEKCGVGYRASEEHRCARLDLARRVLSEASERTGVEYRPPRDLLMPKVEYQVLAQPSGGVEAKAAPKKRLGFDRNAYHKAYMRAYMRGWRARKRAGP